MLRSTLDTEEPRSKVEVSEKEGNNYALIMSWYRGFHIMEISEVENPVLVGSLDTVKALSLYKR